ncbi:hypothetical protein SCA6_006127 [Theobroma cacao]
MNVSQGSALLLFGHCFTQEKNLGVAERREELKEKKLRNISMQYFTVRPLGRRFLSHGWSLKAKGCETLEDKKISEFLIGYSPKNELKPFNVIYLDYYRKLIPVKNIIEWQIMLVGQDNWRKKRIKQLRKQITIDEGK